MPESVKGNIGLNFAADMNVAAGFSETRVGIGINGHGGIDYFFNPDDYAVGFMSVQGTLFSNGSSHGWIGGGSVELGIGVCNFHTIFARIVAGPALVHGMKGPDFDTSNPKLGGTGALELGIFIDPNFSVVFTPRFLGVPNIVNPESKTLWTAQLGLGITGHL